jgi:hypothetical protein
MAGWSSLAGRAAGDLVRLEFEDDGLQRVRDRVGGGGNEMVKAGYWGGVSFGTRSINGHRAA